MLPNTGITTALVGTTLQVNTRDVSRLCSSDNINPWSFHKPVPYNKHTGLVDSWNSSGDYTGEWKGLENDFGLKIVNLTTGATLNGTIQGSVNAVKQCAENYNWQHKKMTDSPTGGLPYRLGDFRGYDHTAKPLFYNNIPHDGTVTVNLFSSNVTSKSFYFIPNSDDPSSTSGWITKDLLKNANIAGAQSLGSMYIVAELWKSNTFISRIFSEGTVDQESTPTIVLPYPSIGTYTVYFALATSKAGVINYLPLPHGETCATKLTLQINSEMPATTKLTGITSVSENSYSDDLSKKSYQSPSYYDDLEQANPLPTDYGKNVVLRVTVFALDTITVSAADVKISNSGSSGIGKLATMVQFGGSTKPSSSSSITTTMERGNLHTWYVMCTDPVVAEYASSTIQLGVYVKGALIAQTPWIFVDWNGAEQ